MYKADLSIGLDEFQNKLTYIGWLTKEKPFPTGDTNDYFLSCLWDFCKYKINLMRGFHQCEFCDVKSDSVLLINFQEEIIKFGYSEIRVFGEQGIVYAAPNLIFHYVQKHNYSPPNEFVDAVCYGVDPNSYEYHELIGKLRTR